MIQLIEVRGRTCQELGMDVIHSIVKNSCDC